MDILKFHKYLCHHSVILDLSMCKMQFKIYFNAIEHKKSLILNLSFMIFLKLF